VVCSFIGLECGTTEIIIILEAEYFWRNSMLKRVGLVISIVLIVVGTNGFAASFQGLGDLAGGSFESAAYAVSADGSVVVGYGTTESGRQPFRYTQNTGMVGLGGLFDGEVYSYASGVSGDGAVVTGTCRTASRDQAFRWTSETGMIGLGYLTNYSYSPDSEACDISADGQTIIGNSSSTSGFQAFRWTFSTDIVGIGYLGKDCYSGTFLSRAYAVSDNGSVVVGYSSSPLHWQPFRWTKETGMVGLGYLPGGKEYGGAYGVSADGSVVVGWSRNTVPLHEEAFRWTSRDGMVGLGFLPGGEGSWAEAVSADGSVVVGSAHSPNGAVVYGDNPASTQEAFYWTASGGMQSIKDILTKKCGLDLTGWILTEAYGVSADGLTVVGNGINPDGQKEAWIATISQPVAPTANAGKDQAVYALFDSIASVTLDGSDSNDPDGDALTYKWTWVVDANTYEANGVSPTIELPVGVHTIQLVVNDGVVDSLPDEVNITVVAPIQGKLSVMPCVINRASNDTHVLANVRLPDGIKQSDIDSNEPLTLYPGDIESARQWILPCNERGRWFVNIFAFFDKDALTDAAGQNGCTKINVAGKLKSGQYFYGCDTVMIMGKKPQRPWWMFDDGKCGGRK
jgi:probable HAF family extracellular repeat protein